MPGKACIPPRACQVVQHSAHCIPFHYIVLCVMIVATFGCIWLHLAEFRMDETTCEGLGVALCGTPSVKVQGGITAQMVNKKWLGNSQELRIEVSFARWCAPRGPQGRTYRGCSALACAHALLQLANTC